MKFSGLNFSYGIYNTFFLRLTDWLFKQLFGHRWWLTTRPYTIFTLSPTYCSSYYIYKPRINFYHLLWKYHFLLPERLNSSYKNDSHFCHNMWSRRCHRISGPLFDRYIYGKKSYGLHSSFNGYKNFIPKRTEKGN